MRGKLDERIAQTMETDVRLLPLLPELLADLQELGTSADGIVSALRSVGIEPGAHVLDLGCGKGAVAVALAERLGARVEGVDAFSPFLEEARALAVARGVAARCVFRQADILRMLGTEAAYVAVLLLSVGPVAGDHRETVAGLRTLVRPGGWIVIEDGFLADGSGPLPGCEGYADRSETLRRLTSWGDVIVRETVCSPEETRAMNENNTALIRKRAHGLVSRHPALAAAIRAYIARQERETEILGKDLVCATWVLRRA